MDNHTTLYFDFGKDDAQRFEARIQDTELPLEEVMKIKQDN